MKTVRSSADPRPKLGVLSPVLSIGLVRALGPSTSLWSRLAQISASAPLAGSMPKPGDMLLHSHRLGKVSLQPDRHSKQPSTIMGQLIGPFCSSRHLFSALKVPFSTF